jgi:hypothetical protein
MSKKQGKRTGITIEYVRIINDDGEKAVQITHLHAMRSDELPSEYLKSEPSFYLWMPNSVERYFLKSGSNERLLVQGYSYTLEGFNKIMEYIKAAGNRLRIIHQSHAEKRRRWKGRGRIKL